MRIRLALASMLAIGSMIATGCSSSTDDSSATDQAETSAPASSESCAYDETVGGVTAVAAVDATPELTVAKDAEDPTELQITDLCVGEGAEATAADTVTVDYVGVGYKTQQEFDSSYERGAPASFPLGQVIPGWTQGVSGMKPGGVRLLLIPADQAYGEQGRPPVIEPSEALAFIVELHEEQVPDPNQVP